METCKGCDKEFTKDLLIPETKEKAKHNFYGGYVCSKGCDMYVSIQIESSMPGAGSSNRLGTSSERHYNNNWNR